ncbi:MAG: hypothetical protein JJU33_14765 [Phycisphaerales bacterium]|nr:hypothetical protein [Phycisphaerales bacterium]
MDPSPAPTGIDHEKIGGLAGLDPVALWSALVSDAGLAAFVCDEHGIIRYANRRLTRPLRERSVVGRHFDAVFGPETAPYIRECLHRTGRTPRAVAYEGMFNGVEVLGVFRRVSLEGAKPSLTLGMFRRRLDMTPEDWASHLDSSSIVRGHRDLGLLASLRPREREVLGMIGDGLTASEIGQGLGISQKTVEWYRAQIGHKLGVRSRAELIRVAIGAGLTSVPRWPPKEVPEQDGPTIRDGEEGGPPQKQG